MLISAYCRVSTDSIDQTNSYENQQTYFSREIRAKGHQIYRIYADKGLTGTKLNNRPEFFAMLNDAGIDIKTIKTIRGDARVKTRHTVYEVSDRKPLFDEIWIKNTSRFARNTLSYELIALLRQKGVNIYFVEQNINTNNLEQDLLLKLMQIFDEQDSKDKSLKVITGIHESAKRGVIRTSGKIFGYKYNKESNSLSIIEEEANIIRTIFELYAQDYGIRKVIQYLSSNNMFTRNGKPFGKTTIKRILANEKYAGFNNILKYDTGTIFNKNTYAKVRDNYIIEQCDRIPAIVSYGMFVKCKEILESKINHKLEVGKYNSVSKYGQLLICGQCGCKYYANSDNGNKLYNCSGKKHIKNGCTSRNLYEKNLDKEMTDLLNNGFDRLQKHQITIIYRNILYIASERIKEYDRDKDVFAAETLEKINSIHKKLDGYYELYSNPDIRKDFIIQKIKIAEDELANLENKYSDIKLSNETIISDLTKIKNILLKIKKYTLIQTPTNIEEMLTQIDSITVEPNSLCIKLKYPDDVKSVLGEYDLSEEDVSTNIDPIEILNKLTEILNSVAGKCTTVS